MRTSVWAREMGIIVPLELPLAPTLLDPSLALVMWGILATESTAQVFVLFLFLFFFLLLLLLLLFCCFCFGSQFPFQQTSMSA